MPTRCRAHRRNYAQKPVAAVAPPRHPGRLLGVRAARRQVDRSRPSRRNHRHQPPPSTGSRRSGKTASSPTKSVSSTACASLRRSERRSTWRVDTRSDAAVAAVDALTQATELKMVDVELLVDRYRGPPRHQGRPSRSRTCRRWRSVAEGNLVAPAVDRRGVSAAADTDRGPQRMGLGRSYLDMGWEDIKVAVEYDGEHHRSNRYQYVQGHPSAREAGRTVTAGSWSGSSREDHPEDIIRRVRRSTSLAEP